MTNVSEWSVTAGLNNSSPPDGWPEGMARSAVNDCAREMMAALSKWYKDTAGSLVTAGTGNAYTLATNNVYTALNDIPALVFRTDRANTGAITLNVDGLGALAVTRNGAAFTSGDIASGQLMVVAYNATSGAFDYLGMTTVFDSGTRMLFQQTAAPSGWTKDTSSHNDKALRLVTGTASSGGSTAFTSVLTSRTIGTGNLPAHSHPAGTLSVSTTINVSNGATLTQGSSTSIQEGAAASHSNMREGLSTQTVTASLASGAVSNSTANTGGGTAMDFAVQYADAIIASKA